MITIPKQKFIADILKNNAETDGSGEGCDFFDRGNDEEYLVEGDTTKKYDYIISGPTAKAFHASSAAIKLLRGPVGSGKTTAAVRAVFAKMCQTPPNDKGERNSIILVARETLPQLRTTTLPSFIQSAPVGLNGKWSAQNYTMKYRFPLKGTMVNSEVRFQSFPDSRSIVTDLRGAEITAMFLNECCTVPIELLTEGISRTGRYPGDIPKELKTFCVIADTNSFDETDPHYQFWYNKDKIRKMAGDFGMDADKFIQTFDYPSGLGDDPDGRPAENTDHLPPKYYEMLALTHANDENWIDVMVRNKFGSIRSGQPCYPSYDPATHVRRVPPNTSLPIWIGADGGKDACCVICQEEDPGTVNIIDIFRLADDRTGVQAIVEKMYAYLAKTYPPSKYRWVTGAVDPGLQNTGQADSIKNIEFFHSAAKRYKVGKVVPASTNSPNTRIETVDRYFSRNADGRPAIIMDKVNTVWLQRACSVYSWKEEMKRGVARRFADSPDKTIESHIAEALQYALLRPGGYTRAVIRNPDGSILRHDKRNIVTSYKMGGLPTGRRSQNNPFS